MAPNLLGLWAKLLQHAGGRIVADMRAQGMPTAASFAGSTQPMMVVMRCLERLSSQPQLAHVAGGVLALTLRVLEVGCAAPGQRRRQRQLLDEPRLDAPSWARGVSFAKFARGLASSRWVCRLLKPVSLSAPSLLQGHPVNWANVKLGGGSPHPIFGKQRIDEETVQLLGGSTCACCGVVVGTTGAPLKRCSRCKAVACESRHCHIWRVQGG